jgi:hypothetical protein
MVCSEHYDIAKKVFPSVNKVLAKSVGSIVKVLVRNDGN